MFFSQQIQWQKNINSSSQNLLSGIATTIDGQYLISGSSIQSSKSSSFGDKNKNNGYDFHLVKLNQDGQQTWEKYISGDNHDFLIASKSTLEGGFIIAGNTYSSKNIDKTTTGYGGADIWLIKLSENGKEEWQRSFGTANDDEVVSITQTSDLGFIVAGNTDNLKNGFGSKDIWLIKLDKQGNQTSQIFVGGKGLDESRKVIATRDGGFLVGAYSQSKAIENREPFKVITDPENPNVTNFIAKKSEGFGEGDYWLLKFDKNSKLEWERSFGGVSDDGIKTLDLTIDGYIIGGESNSKISGNKKMNLLDGSDLWYIAIDAKGQEVWQKQYSFGKRDILMASHVVYSADDTHTKGLIIGGFTQGGAKTEADDETFWLLYLDNSGKEMWRKYIRGETKNREERLADVKIDRNGSIILTGTSAPKLGKENWKVIKLEDKSIQDVIEKLDIKIYPNPVEDLFYVEVSFDFDVATIEIFDMGGRLISSQETHSKITKINANNLVQGAYLVLARTENKFVSAKIIKK